MSAERGHAFKLLDPTGATYRQRRDGSTEMVYTLPRPGEKYGPWMEHPHPTEPDGKACGPGGFHAHKRLSWAYAPLRAWPWWMEWEDLIGEDEDKVRVRRCRLRRIAPKLLWRAMRRPFNWGKRAYLRGANLRRADLRGANLSRADLSDADLRGADLRGADLRDTYLDHADLHGADLGRAALRGADLSGADLSSADLSRADLRGAYLYGADLRDADLSRADLSGADLSGANLDYADLRDADLRDADLHGAYLGCADLSGAMRSDESKEPARNDPQAAPPVGK